MYIPGALTRRRKPLPRRRSPTGPSDLSWLPSSRETMKHQAEDHPKQALATGRIAGEGGFSMIATALGLAATAILTAVLLGTMLDSNGTTANGISREPGVAEAGALQAQQTLTTGLTTVDTAAISGGGYGSLQPSADGIEPIDHICCRPIDQFRHHQHGRDQRQRRSSRRERCQRRKRRWGQRRCRRRCRRRWWHCRRRGQRRRRKCRWRWYQRRKWNCHPG